jgi:uncharacterized membrane protein YgcG
MPAPRQQQRLGTLASTSSSSGTRPRNDSGSMQPAAHDAECAPLLQCPTIITVQQPGEARAQHGAHGSHSAGSDGGSGGEDQQQPLTCRICFDSVGPGEAHDPHNPLISPCLCSGSSRYVHRQCLQQWRQTNHRADAFYECEVCKYRCVVWGRAHGAQRLYARLAACSLAACMALARRACRRPHTRRDAHHRKHRYQYRRMWWAGLLGSRATVLSLYVLLMAALVAVLGCVPVADLMPRGGGSGSSGGGGGGGDTGGGGGSARPAPAPSPPTPPGPPGPPGPRAPPAAAPPLPLWAVLALHAANGVAMLGLLGLVLSSALGLARACGLAPAWLVLLPDGACAPSCLAYTTDGLGCAPCLECGAAGECGLALVVLLAVAMVAAGVAMSAHLLYAALWAGVQHACAHAQQMVENVQEQEQPQKRQRVVRGRDSASGSGGGGGGGGGDAWQQERDRQQRRGQQGPVGGAVAPAAAAAAAGGDGGRAGGAGQSSGSSRSTSASKWGAAGGGDGLV